MDLRMSVDDGMSRGRFRTASARAAAIEGRRRKHETAPSRDALTVFLVRGGTGSPTFGWEIRKFGAIVVQRGEVFHDSAAAARAEGEAALARLATE